MIVTAELDTAKFPSPHELQQTAKKKMCGKFHPFNEINVRFQLTKNPRLIRRLFILL